MNENEIDKKNIIYDKSSNIVSKKIKFKLFIKENYKFLIFILILTAYYLSPLSIFFWNRALMFLIHIFLFPFFLMPEDSFIISAGYAPGVIPNPFTIAFAIFISSVWIMVFSFLINLIAKKLKIKSILVFILAILIFLVLGGFGEQNICERDFESYRNEKGEKYLKNLGVIHFVVDTNMKRGLDFFYKLNGLEYISGDSNNGRILARIKSGDEYRKICQIKAYRQVYEGTTPMEESGLFFINNQEYWNLIDNNFCETDQLVNHSKEDCLKSIEKGFMHKGETDSRDKILPLTEEYTNDLIAFSYPKSWHIFKKEEDGKGTVRISKSVDGNFKLYALIDVSKCVPSLETIGEQLLKKQEEGELDSNYYPKGVEKVEIGDFNFYKYIQSDKKYGSEETNYEAKVNGIYLINISVFHTGYDDYIDDIKRMIETIELPDNSKVELIDYEDNFLKISYNKNAYQFSKADSTDVNTIYELKNVNKKEQSLVRGVIYKGFEEHSLDDRYNIFVSQGKTTNSKHQKIKLGKYEFIKTKDANNSFTQYTTFIGLYEVNFVLDYGKAGMYMKDENLENILKTLVLKI